jgi:uncharacterized cupredoxin-like copper-binding protein
MDLRKCQLTKLKKNARTSDFSQMRISFGPPTLAAAVAASLALGGCGSGSTPAAHQPTTRITERDFRISVPNRLSSGEHMLTVHNKGPARHELIVVRVDGELPMRRDGVTVDEDAVERHKVGALEPGTPGATRRLRVSLRPGRYAFFCNMFGHYLGGMDRDVVVG